MKPLIISDPPAIAVLSSPELDKVSPVSVKEAYVVKLNRRSRLSMWAKPLLLAAVLLPWTGAGPLPAQAAVPKLDSIRVALYIDSGKANISTTAVTLSSDKGLDVGWKSTAAGTIPASAIEGSGLLKASLDTPRVVLLETADSKQADALYKKLKEQGKPAGIALRQRAGQAMLQVYAGPYASKEAAGAAKDQLAGLTAGFTTYVTGQQRLSAGAYATEAEALAQAQAVSMAGFDADIAYYETGGALIFAVWIGNESSAEALNALKQRAQAALTGVSLEPVNPAVPYALKRMESAGGTSTASIAHYALSSAGKAALTVSAKQQGLKVAEKSGRVYRGTVELSQLNGKLAVINELPFEQYLYSVVGSELSKDWPAESLKAQAVAARTFALTQGVKYQIAHVTDSSLDQVYYGVTSEAQTITAAVDATQGEVLTDSSGLITPFFFSNAGGLTADPIEVWGKPISYLQSTPSPDDGADKPAAAPTKPVVTAAVKPSWYKVMLANGTSGYIFAEYVKATGTKNSSGQPIYESTGTNVNVRKAPNTNNATNPPITQVDLGDRFAVLDEPVQETAASTQAVSNAYSWTRGPYTAEELLKMVNAGLGAKAADRLDKLEISARGPSGRVTEMKLNGQVIKVQYPDAFRGLFGGLPSTRFEIEETGSYTIGNTASNSAGEQAAPPAGSTPSNANPAGSAIYVLGAGGQTVKLDRPSAVYKIDASNQVKQVASAASGSTGAASVPTAAPGSNGAKLYTFKGKGNGHGLGMSQWGAKGYAELGYDYKKILQTYYVGVSIVKE
jgi:stage II sporulation protein D